MLVILISTKPFALASHLDVGFIGPRPLIRPNGSARFAEAAVDTVEAEPEPAEPKEPEIPVEGSVTIVQGVTRTRVPWASEETCALLRERIEEATGIPAAKQQLKLANQELLAEGNEKQSSYEASGKIRTIWLEDLRTPGERGEEEKTFIDELKQFWKLDNVTVVSLALVVYTFFKELLPLFLEGVKNPLQDLPWQPGPIDQFPPSPI